MFEQSELQRVPVRAYRSDDRLTVAAPMPGLEAEDITVEVTAEGRLQLHGELRGTFKDMKDVLLSEWSVGGYHRELELPFPVDGEQANVTYGNGVLVVVLPIAERTRPAQLRLEETGLARGQRVGHTGSEVEPTTTAEHQAAVQQRQNARR